MTFRGWPVAALEFYVGLEADNSKAYWHAHRPAYESDVKAPFVELSDLVAREFGELHVFRPNRDTRFSKDKTPYKTHIAAAFGRQGLTKNADAAFYFSVSHTGVEIAGGMYMPGPDELAAVRAAIADDAATFRKLVSSKPLCKVLGKMQGTRTARMPKAFPADHPAADLLQMKQFYFYVILPAESATKPTLRRDIIKRFKLLTPFVNYLNEAVLRKLHEDGKGADAIPRRPAPMF